MISYSISFNLIISLILFIDDFNDNETDMNICWTNEKRISYDKNSQKVMLATGMNVISRINAKSLDLYNNEMFKINRIKNNIITIVDETRTIEIPVENFQRIFYVAFATTVHRVQGETIRYR